jgi:hypothetical protein
MNGCNRILTYSLILGVNISLAGCDSPFWSNHHLTDSATPIASPVPSTPAAPAAPNPAPQPTESTVPFTVLTAPPFAQPHSVQPPPVPIGLVRENYACLTTNYFADIIWQQDQPRMTFGRKPSETATRDALTTVKSNPDGSFTYATTQASLFYTRVYPDRTCLLQIVNPTSGIATLEENGKLGKPVFDNGTVPSGS